MTRPPTSFADRLSYARAMLAAGAPQPPSWLADQYGAARDEARGLHDRMGVVLPILQPGAGKVGSTARTPTRPARSGATCWPVYSPV